MLNGADDEAEDDGVCECESFLKAIGVISLLLSEGSFALFVFALNLLRSQRLNGPRRVSRICGRRGARWTWNGWTSRQWRRMSQIGSDGWPTMPGPLHTGRQ
jgi:hypothetical protein